MALSLLKFLCMKTELDLNKFSITACNSRSSFLYFRCDFQIWRYTDILDQSKTSRVLWPWLFIFAWPEVGISNQLLDFTHLESVLTTFFAFSSVGWIAYAFLLPLSDLSAMRLDDSYKLISKVVEGMFFERLILCNPRLLSAVAIGMGGSRSCDIWKLFFRNFR